MDKETIEHNLKELMHTTLALQVLFAHLTDRLSGAAPELRSVVRGAFDDASRELEDISIQGRESPYSKQAVEALRVIEEIRTAAIGDHDKPNGVI